MLNALLGPSALDHMESATSQFEQTMRYVRPIVLILVLSFWPIIVDLASRLKLLTPKIAALATRYWLHLALWTAVIEITIGQGRIVIGLILGALVYVCARRNLIPTISVATEANDR